MSNSFCFYLKKEFYERLGHLPMYIKYIYQLYEMNRRLGNKIEAGHTLMLHAKLLEVNFYFFLKSKNDFIFSGIQIKFLKKFI